MAQLTDLYEVLDVPHDASAEQIRKAYRKKALQTHPDRLATDATEEQRRATEEAFRKVSNAYEVLNDPQKRQTYDAGGVWPPESPQNEDFNRDQRPRQRARRHHHHHHHSRDGRRHHPFGPSPFSEPFFEPFFDVPPPGQFPGPHSHYRPSFGFTDPFELFNGVFRDMNRFDVDPFFSPTHPPFSSPFSHHAGMFGPSMFSSPFDRDPFFAGPFGSMGAFDGPHHGGFLEGSSRSFFGDHIGGSGAKWVSESHASRTINGVTESVWKRTDSSGNEHITRTYPDGRQVYTINGREQRPPPAAISNQAERTLPPPPPYQAQPSAQPSAGFIPPPPTIQNPVVQDDHKKKWWSKW
ncbi:DnaJ-domain-containing protein [Sistotremastrum suecicum HHB10207 ss-3]|uniref:DnaJ-domain-containing protein n=1 Tax=Sistotremastrum suecicum HHB10207 ss-3 TaxID=1314776 RepID=A0A165ZEX5_9AGAM|nr:DnaJ-domain-containing protein [Sistotremastrum suecicum HHB10207 ss-3]